MCSVFSIYGTYTKCKHSILPYKFTSEENAHCISPPEAEATSGHRLFPPSVGQPSHHMKLLSALTLLTHRKGRDESSKNYSAQFGTFEALGWGRLPLSGWPRGQRRFYDNSENDDDVTSVISSISSLSMATIDDNPHLSSSRSHDREVCWKDRVSLTSPKCHRTADCRPLGVPSSPDLAGSPIGIINRPHITEHGKHSTRGDGYLWIQETSCPSFVCSACL